MKTQRPVNPESSPGAGGFVAGSAIQGTSVSLGVANFTAVAMNCVQKNVNFDGWQPLASFMRCPAATNLLLDVATNAGRIYRSTSRR